MDQHIDRLKYLSGTITRKFAEYIPETTKCEYFKCTERGDHLVFDHFNNQISVMCYDHALEVAVLDADHLVTCPNCTCMIGVVV